MTAAAMLKPPPNFVKNEWAWAYTLNKLSDRDGLDEWGNPLNYGAAVAIYKRVAAKYGNPESEVVLPAPTAPPLVRADMIALHDRQWVVGRGFAYTTTADAAVRVWFEDDGCSYIEQVLDTGSWRTDPIEWDTVEWLLDRSPVAMEWACEQIGPRP